MLCSDLLWDAQSVSRKQVPTLQDAFLCCDRETLLSVVEQGYAYRLPGWGQATPQQRRVARKRMGRALNAMLDCAVKRKSGKALCIFPEERFIVHARRGQACIERLVQARVVDLSAGAVRQDAAEGACLCGKMPPKARACSAALPGRKFFRIAYGSKAPGIAASATWSLQVRSGI